MFSVAITGWYDETKDPGYAALVTLLQFSERFEGAHSASFDAAESAVLRTMTQTFRKTKWGVWLLSKVVGGWHFEPNTQDGGIVWFDDDTEAALFRLACA